MNYDYGLLDKFYLSEDSITDKKFYPSGIYTIIDITTDKSYIIVNSKYLIPSLLNIRVTISQFSLETLFKTSLIEEYEHYETN